MSRQPSYDLLASSVRLLEETVVHQRRCISKLLDQVTLLDAGPHSRIAPPQILIPDPADTTNVVTCLSSKSARVANKVPEVVVVTVPTARLLCGFSSSSGPEYSDIPRILEHANELVPRPLPVHNLNK